MRVVAAVISAALVAALPAGSAHAAPKKKHRCTAKGAQTVTKNRYARVFETPGREGTETSRLYGCLYAQGRRVLLAVEFEDESIDSSMDYSLVRLKGRRVAWHLFIYDNNCKTICDPSYDPRFWRVETFDLRRPKREAEYIEVDNNVSALVLTRTGAVAWIEGGKVRARDADGVRELDPGPADPESLHLRGSTVSWRTNGVLRSAPLH